MTLNQRFQEVRSGFDSTFWIANVLELFERLAFYGTKGVITFFIAKKVGLENEAATLASLFSGVIYSLPIFAGVLVDRYGFRKTLLACFAMFSIGYFLIGLAGMEWGQELVAFFGKRNYIIGVLLLTAIGGSLIKPCIVGTVAKTSKESTRALGFSIYYSLVNLGGAIGPMIAYSIRQDMGIEYVLMMSSITSLALFIGTLFFFKEPTAVEGDQAEKLTFGKVFSNMLTVFGNVKFIGFLIIFSGFWIMFWQIFYLLPFYSVDVLKFEQFEYLETVDAWFIIIFSPIMATVLAKWKPFTAMTVGFLIASLSWIVIGSVPTVMAVVIAVALFALGEATQAPRFYEYVSNLAPKEQVGTYMGFAFLPVAIGSFAAGAIADWLRNNYMSTNPSAMWYIVAAIGLICTILMIAYDRAFVKKRF